MSKTLSTEQAMRYNRQILLPGFDLDKQEILLNSKVLQIGVGGLGCAVSQYIVAAGVGHITLVDDDVVEHTNLPRQVLHTEADLGVAKCVSAKASLSVLNSHARINIIQQRLDDETLLEQVKLHDIVMDCSDNLATRNQLNQACIQQQKPLVSGAAIRMEGQLCCFVPEANNACYQCLSTMIGEQPLSCVETGVMSPIVGVIGAMQALETIKILTHYGEALINKLMVFDGLTMQWQTFSIPKNNICQACMFVE